MKELNDKIIEWLKKHNIDKLSPDKQYLKIIEEVGELARGLLKNDLEAIKDAIGDIYIALVGYSLQLKVYEDNYINYMQEDDFIMIQKLTYLLTQKIFTEQDYILSNGCLEVISINHNLTLKECVDHAYNQIKDRNIKIIEGVAVK